MNTSVVYKYRTLEGIIKYEVLSGEFGVDSTLHLRDTSCKHYGDRCEIEVVMCEDGKCYQFSKSLNDSAKRYEFFHTMEKFWDNEKDAFVEGGSGFGYTFRPMYGTLRIDYILHSNNLETKSYSVDTEVTLSDHLPITARMKFSK